MSTTGALTAKLTAALAEVLTQDPISGGAWTPSELSGDFAWYDASDLSTLYQSHTDGVPSTPVTSAGDPVGYIGDKSGNGYNLLSSGANRPTYRVDAWGKGYVDFEGAEYMNASALDTFMESDFDIFLEMSCDAAQNGTDQMVMDRRIGGNPGTTVNILFGFTAGALEANINGSRTAVSGHPVGFRTVAKFGFDHAGNGTGAVTINDAETASDTGNTPTMNDDYSATLGRASNTTAGNRYWYGRFYGGLFLQAGGYTGSDVWTYLKGRLPKAHLYLIAGQSNAEGRGSSASAPSVDAGTAYEFASGAVSELADPVGNANTGSAWPAFCDGYAAAVGGLPILAEVAAGGAAQDADADSGNGNWDVDSTLYTAAVTAATDMASYCDDYGIDYIWGGVLWSQGERDAQEIDAASGYAIEDYVASFDAMWAEMKVDISPSLKMWIARTGRPDSADTSGFQAIRDAQDDFATDNGDIYMAFEGAVDFPGESKMSDNLHYNQTGYNEMGTAMQSAVASNLTS